MSSRRAAPWSTNGTKVLDAIFKRYRLNLPVGRQEVPAISVGGGPRTGSSGGSERALREAGSDSELWNPDDGRDLGQLGAFSGSQPPLALHHFVGVVAELP